MSDQPDPRAVHEEDLRPVAPHRPGRPTTGDRAVDDALAAFDRALAEGPHGQTEAVAEAHRALQARLTTPAPAAPGEVRPGPRP